MPHPPLPPFTTETAAQKARMASIDDAPIAETDRTFHWPAERRPDDLPGLSALGL